MMDLVELAVFTDDVGAMIAFYQTLLGSDPLAQSDGMGIFMVGSTKLFIHRNYAPNPGELPPENHWAFAVTDVDATCEKLGRRGMMIEVEPQSYYWGRSAYLRDPDGHLIELIESSPAEADD